MKKSRVECVHDIERYLSEKLDGVEYGDCLPDYLQQLKNEYIRNAYHGKSVDKVLNEIDEYIKAMKSETLVRCNMCYTIYNDDSKLKLINDHGEWVRVCEDCKTDAYLTNLKESW